MEWKTEKRNPLVTTALQKDFPTRVLRSYTHLGATLESGIDVGQGINVGPGKFVKKNKRRALKTRIVSSK